jgi:hypothetical protein
MRIHSTSVALSFLLTVLSAGWSEAQTSYEVTAHLDPFFVHPVTGVDLTEGRTWKYNAWERGADGRFYLYRTTTYGSWGELFQIVQVSPTTGAARVLVVGEAQNGTVSDLYRGQGGRLYFTALDGLSILYEAPGYSAGECGGRGCVMMLDTAGAGQPLLNLYDFYLEEEGYYPDGILAEDLDGAVYVKMRNPGSDCNEESTYIRVYGAGSIDVLCSPPFQIGTVVRSDNRWEWSDGLSYRVSVGNVVYQDNPPNAPLVLTTIAASDGSLRSLVEGAGYLYGVTEGGGALNGGVVFRVRVDSLASPDLQVSALSPPPIVAAPGELFAVTETTHNNGPEPAAASRTTVYLSASGDTPEIKVGNANRYLDELAPGQSTTGSRNVIVPVSVLSGSYWLMACADAGTEVPEQEETNNCALAETKVLIAQPDLRQRDVSTASTSAAPGGKIVVTDTVDNPSAVTALASTTRYYLSLNNTRDGGDILLIGKRSIQNLASVGVNAGSATVTLPNPVAAGTYFLLACADDLAKVKESDEMNNCAATTTTLLVGQADLVITSLTAPPATSTPGGKFTITDSVTNQGSVAAISTSTRFLLSLNTTRDGADILLTGARAVAELLPSQTSTGSRSVTVPLTAAIGSYYVLACADDTQRVQESSEGNNCQASATKVLVGWPDLLTTTVSNPPADLPIGATFTVTDTASNQGNVSAGASTTRYYFSLDAIRSGNDVLLAGSRSVPILSPGANSAGSKILKVPAVTANAYYVLACADDPAKVGESDNANNCRASAVTTSVHP